MPFLRRRRPDSIERMGDVDLHATLGVAPVERDVIRVHGPEAIGFLQGQLSQEIDGLPVGVSVPTLLLQPTGKVEAWLRATRIDDDVVLLDVEAGFGAAVLARLRRFKLRTKADLDLETWTGWAVRGPGASGAGWAAAWPGVEGYDLLTAGGASPPSGPVVTTGVLEALRIECGVPAMGAELTSDTIPAEAGQWLIDASVSFTKGCYTGQELVARIDSRGGNVPRPLRGLRIDALEASIGSPVRAGDAVVGALTSVAHSAALGTIALAPLPRAVEVGAVVAVGDASATVTLLPMR